MYDEHMTYHDARLLAIEKWNAQADQYNQWGDLEQDEKDKLIAKELSQ